jgi:hypothetical protein
VVRAGRRPAGLHPHRRRVDHQGRDALLKPMEYGANGDPHTVLNALFSNGSA